MSDGLGPQVQVSVAEVSSLWVLLGLCENLDLIGAERRILIVPDDQVEVFGRVLGTEAFEITSESSLLSPGQIEQIREMVSLAENPDRFGWYLQQFLKLSALEKFSQDYDRLIIWDADTIPLRQIDVFDSDGTPRPYFGSEHHQPYFDAIYRVLGIRKTINRSFIAQTFPITGKQASNFFASLGGTGWFEKLLSAIDFSEGSGFSEYETLGTFIYRDRAPQWSSGKWTRYGNKFTTPMRAAVSRLGKLLKFDYLAFESWSISPFERLKGLWTGDFAFYSNKLATFIFGNLEQTVQPRSNLLDIFLGDLFAQAESLHVLQIGANDGIQNDPLRKHLANSKATAVLVEPLPYYFHKLSALYSEESGRIRIKQVAIGAKEGQLILYSIPPCVANLMNDRVPNDWAHGQGSTSLNFVKGEILNNSWRGPRYRRQIEVFLRSIEETEVRVVNISEVAGEHAIDLLVIDVQGFEVDVLSGLGTTRPRFILCETSENRETIFRLLISLGYRAKIDLAHDALFEYPLDQSKE